MNSKEILEKAKIKLLAMDVDGTLTDSAMYYSERGEELKRFSTRDGMGITLLHKAGFQTAIITSEESQIVNARAKKLNIKNVILGSKNKLIELKTLAKKLSLNLDELAYIGDDVNDIEAMKAVGLSACPADAVNEVKEIADITLNYNGGNGAVREFVEILLSFPTL